MIAVNPILHTWVANRRAEFCLSCIVRFQPYNNLISIEESGLLTMSWQEHMEIINLEINCHYKNCSQTHGYHNTLWLHLNVKAVNELYTVTFMCCSTLNLYIKMLF